MSVSKGAIIALTLIGGGTVGAGVALTMDEVGEPYLHFLFEDEGYSDKIKDGGEYKGKYGETYGKYLIGVTNSKVKKTTESNERWWLWSFNNRYVPNQSKIKDKFSSGINNQEDLKNKCLEAYKATDTGDGSTITTSTEGLDQNKFLESNIWLFCSPAEEKIKSVADENEVSSEYTATSIYGNDDATKKDLVSVLSESKGNAWFWDFQEYKYRYTVDTDELKITNVNIKEWCKQAYKATAITDSYTKDNVFKLCSLSGKTPTTSQ